MKDLSSIRTEYSKATLDSTTINSDPFAQFQVWLHEAISAQVGEPTAMNLATVNEHGRPTSRIVLLKGVENEKFVFYTNYQSKKGLDMEQNPGCALNFFWAELERQVRIEGTVSRVDAKRSEEYFQSRPRASQIGAWASPQSTVIASREIIEERVKQLEERFKGQEVLPKPQQWGGFEVEPFMIEFWQGRESRLHDRILYTKAESAWEINRLAP
jgi:pyridoxamine 5'-phosphate oxidase